MSKIMVLNPPSRFAKNVARDLIYGCWCKGKRIAAAKFPPATLLQVATVLENDKNEVILLDTQAEDKKFEDAMDIVLSNKPEIIIIPTSTMSFNEDMETLRSIKAKLKVTTLAYGSHVTFMPKASLSQGGADYIALREPEFIIRDFVRAFREGKDVKKIKGLAFRKGKGIVINPPYPFIENLDRLPIIDRKPILKFAYFNPLVRRLPWTTMITSRGCPGRCTFCSSPSFYGKELRYRSAKSVVDEIGYLIKLGYREIFFRDETFTAHRQRLVDICNMIIAKKLDITWICNARIGNLNKEVLQLMKKAGCHTIKFGVESGVQEILNNINKGINVEMTRKTFKWCHEVGMDTHAHMMLGCTGETWETVNRTIRFLREIEPTTVTCGAMTPYPGTELYEKIRKKRPEIGDGSKCDLSTLHTSGFFSKEICSLSDEEVGKAVKLLYRKFYLRPSYVFGRLLSIRSFVDARRLLFAGLDVLSFTAGSE